MPFIKESFQISAPQRVIAFLRQILQLSMKDAQKFVDKGRVEQNGEVVRDKTRALQGEVSVSHFKAVDLGIAPIFEAPDFVAFDKPAGLLSHPKGRFWHFSLLDAVRFHLGSEANLINRLDYETSGLVLASKNKKSEAELKTLFETRRVEKSYLALVEGKLDSALGNSSLGMQFRTCEKFWESTDSCLVLSQNFSQIQKPHRKYFDFDSQSESLINQAKNTESALDSAIPKHECEKSLRDAELCADFVIDLPITEGKMGSDLGIRSRVCESGKPSQTAVKILHYDCKKNQTLLKVTPLTGRTHQIRVHLAHIGHKIVGDGLYGTSDESAREFLAQKAQNLGSKPFYNAINPAESSAESRLMLHAQSLRFCYKNKEYFICAPPAEFCAEF